jgi:aryl-alcohol dehydrogenase-like predicted oxidoreductase
VLAEVEKEFGISLAATGLQFTLAHTIVTSVIPGPRSKNELQEILTWQLCYFTPKSHRAISLCKQSHQVQICRNFIFYGGVSKK